MSTQYYTVHFIRRIFFILSQVYLNNHVIIQAGLNIAFSFMQTGFLIIYRPYKERSVLLSIIAGETAASLAILLSSIFIYKINDSSTFYLEFTIMLIVICAISVQFIIAILVIVSSIKKIWKKIMHHEGKPIEFSQISPIYNVTKFSKRANHRKVTPLTWAKPSLK